MKGSGIGFRRAAKIVLLASFFALAIVGSTRSAQTVRLAVLHSRSDRLDQLVDRAASRTTSKQARELVGFTVGIDPGHNGRNYTDPSYIDRLIWNGREYETCNTTGTETDGGYTEAQFNFNVATYLAHDLIAQGAHVVMTRHSNDGVGPCVNVRAAIINKAHANVAIDIHADGGPPDGRGFALLEPVADGPNDAIISASLKFGSIVRAAMLSTTGMPVSTYDGVDGIEPRDNLAGLNLTQVPEVLIESGNMRNATDAALLVTSRFQKLEAAALDAAITSFLTESCHNKTSPGIGGSAAGTNPSGSVESYIAGVRW